MVSPPRRRNSSSLFALLLARSCSVVWAFFQQPPSTPSFTFPRHQTKRTTVFRLYATTDDSSNRRLENPKAMPFNGTDYPTKTSPNGEAAAAPPPTTNVDVSSILAIDPADIQIVTVENPVEEVIKPSEDILRRLPFVNMFRGSANYIANHRNTLAVYHIPGGLLDLPDPSIFRDLMNDVALTWLLGMKVVLVVGCRHQIEKRVKDPERFHGLRVTDENTLRIVKEEAGYVRFEVERQMARSLRLQGAGGGGVGGSTSQEKQQMERYYEGNVVSGNFYSAQPFGILDGTDYRE